MFGLDKSFRAMADPTRRAILAALRDGPQNAGDVAARLGLAPSALSFHLRVLKEADLVSDARQGQFIRYTLNTTVVDDLIRAMLSAFGSRESADGNPPSIDGAVEPTTPQQPIPTLGDDPRLEAP